jgi:hypothetical protein
MHDDQAAETDANAPWQSQDVRGDRICYRIIALPQPHHLKLNYIFDRLGNDGERFMTDVLIPAIDKKVEELQTGNAR